MFPLDRRASTRRRLAAAATGIVAALVSVTFHGVPGTAAATPTPVLVPPPTSSQNLPDNYTAPPPPVVRNLAYGDDPAQRLDLYLPVSPAVGGAPVIIYLHSGGWIAGSRANAPPLLLRQVSREGVALASVDYRLAARAADGSAVNPFPAAPQDVDLAIRWIKAMAPAFDLDASRVIVAGESAGGHLAALAGAAPGAFVEPGLPPALARQDPAVAGVIDFVGPSDLAALGAVGAFGAGLETLFLGCAEGRPATCPPARIRAADVATHLTHAAPPAFLAYGLHDTLVVAATQGRPLADQWALARGAGDKAVWYEGVNAGHNLSLTAFNVSAFERWLDTDLVGGWR